MFGIGLRADGNIFTSRHRHRARNKPRHAGQENFAGLGRRGSNADDQARRRDDAVIGAQHRRTKPPDAIDVVFLQMHPEPAHSVLPTVSD